MSDYLAGALFGWVFGAAVMLFCLHKVGLIKTKAQYMADRLDKEACE